MALVDIGRSAEGRPMVMAIVSSPKNLKRLDAYKTIAHRLALTQGLTDAEARRLAAEGKEPPLPSQKFYVPGSILRASVDTSRPLAYGLADPVDVFFDNSPAFDLLPQAQLQGLKPILWFEARNPLRSGWVWGDQYLWRGVEAIDAPVGKGELFLFGPEILFRGQPHGTFKLLFNGIYCAGARTAATS